ncbi:MAG: radical SAM protein [Spirochaetes bacterium]|nr:radical SAM protein [Spirochaetota bacterium]
MKVLLINTNTIKPVIAPIGLEYVGEYLIKNKIDVFTLDLNFENDIKNSIQKTRPDVIGVTIRNTDDCTFPGKGFFLPDLKKILEEIKKSTSSPIVAGGVGFSVMPGEILEFLELDHGICGDGEAFYQFIKNYPAIENVPNLIYRKEGTLITNKVQYSDLSRLNPKRVLFNNIRYFREGGQGSLETKRGCNKACIYCADPVSKGCRIRLRDPESVCDEFQSLLKQNIHTFHLCDSEFNIPYEHASHICEAMIKKDLGKKIKWYAYMSPGPFDLDLAHLMREAGCAGINFGADSGSDKILKTYKRDFTANDLIRTGKDCKKAGLTFMFDLLLGGPGEDEKTCRETIDLMKEIKPDVVGTAMGVRIYNHTGLADMIKEQGIISQNRDLYGVIENNDNFLKPIFFLSSKIGEKIFPFVEDLTSHDKRFLFSYGKNKRDYNYNQNTVLTNAIKAGHRGAFWDILRKLT